MSAKSKSKSVLRSVKNFTKGYSEIEIKVRDATSNDPSLPSTTLMSQICAATNSHYTFMSVMNILDKRLNDKGKNWRHVYKALIVLDYLMHDGSDQVLSYVKDNMFIVKTLQQFQYVDEEGKDHGSAVRAKARDIVSLLEHPDSLLQERSDRNYWMTRFTDDTHSRALGVDNSHRRSNSTDDLRSSRTLDSSNSKARALSNSSIPSYYDGDDADLKRALEESKRLAELEKERRERSEEELKLALELSYYEAENKKKNTMITTSRTPSEPMSDLMDLFEGPPIQLPQQNYQPINLNITNNMPQQLLGSQLGAQQLLGGGGLESVKLNPTFDQGSFGYIPDHSAQQGSMYQRPSLTKQQHGSVTNDPFADLIPSTALVPSGNQSMLGPVQRITNNPFLKSESMTPPSRLSEFDPYSSMGMQMDMVPKIGDHMNPTMPMDMQGTGYRPLMPMLPSSLPSNFNNPMLSNSAVGIPMMSNTNNVILHPTNAISSQYPMNPPFPPNNMNPGSNIGRVDFPQSRRFY